MVPVALYIKGMSGNNYSPTNHVFCQEKPEENNYSNILELIASMRVTIGKMDRELFIRTETPLCTPKVVKFGQWEKP